MAVTEVNALTATEGQERKVVPSRNARRPHPEVPQSNSSKWRSAEDEERKSCAIGRTPQVLYGQWQLYGSSEDIEDARWAYHPPFWHCHWVAFFQTCGDIV